MKQVISMMIAVLCLVAGAARAYEMDDKIGAEIIKVSAGDQGVYGAAKWLREQNLLPSGMSVAEAYVKMCLKNFDTLRECETASLKLQPGQMLKIFAPVVARTTYDERMTKPLKKQIAAKDQQIEAKDREIAVLEAVVGITVAKAEKAEAMLKSKAVEVERIKKENATLLAEKDGLATKNAMLTNQLGASKRAFAMQAVTTEDLKRELSSGLLAKVSALARRLDEFADERLAGMDWSDANDVISLFSAALLLFALMLSRKRAMNEARSAAIIERVIGSRAELEKKNARLKAALARFSPEPREFSLPDNQLVKEKFVLNAVGFDGDRAVFSYKAECGAFVQEERIFSHLDKVHNNGPTRRAKRPDLSGMIPSGTA